MTSVADKENAKPAAQADLTTDATADTGERQPEKRKISLKLPKLPLDMIVLIGIPFVAFVVIFLYAMGYIPAKPVVLSVSVVNPLSGQSGPQSGVPEGLPAAAAESASVVTEQYDVTAGEGVAEGQAEGQATSASGAVADTALSIERLAGELGLADSLRMKSEPDSLADAEKAKKFKQMAKVYEQMNATSAAAIVDKLPGDEAVRILSVMTPRTAAKILAALGPEKAADMSLMLTSFGR